MYCPKSTLNDFACCLVAVCRQFTVSRRISVGRPIDWKVILIDYLTTWLAVDELTVDELTLDELTVDNLTWYPISD